MLVAEVAVAAELVAAMESVLFVVLQSVAIGLLSLLVASTDERAHSHFAVESAYVSPVAEYRFFFVLSK